MSVLLEFAISPLDKGESLSPYVGRVAKIIDASGVPYRMGPMGTCLEGEWDEVMSVVQSCYQELARDCRRISCSIKIDARQGASGRLTAKVRRVEQVTGLDLGGEAGESD